MKTALTVIFLIAAFLWIAQLEVTFDPFTIKLKRWMYAVGFILVLIGIIFIQIDAYRNGSLKAYTEAIKIIKEESK